MKFTVTNAVVALIVIVVWTACSSRDEGGNIGTGIPPKDIGGDSSGDNDTNQPETDTASPDVQVAEDMSNDIELVERNPACGEYDDGVYGKKVPWQGFEYEGKNYTCNTCRGGAPNIVGTWRFVDFDTEDPDTPLTDNYKETLTFDGNTWTQHSSGIDAGQFVDATISGWYFCGIAPEVNNSAKIFITESVVPEGAFGWNSGLVFSALTLKQGNDKLDFNFWTGLNTGSNYDALYCRVGAVIKTLNGTEKLCPDPFSEP
ncbi:MAG: hypothetical protein HUU55_17840 [Myxococcales bacterium]|nr:hypothetical protein [Myxococcales bacterium]